MKRTRELQQGKDLSCCLLLLLSWEPRIEAPLITSYNEATAEAEADQHMLFHTKLKLTWLT
jgi:hypothetical protein